MLGAMHAASFATDPKHLGFVLARYHFVAHHVAGMRNVLEVGCGDGTGAREVAGRVRHLLGVDIEDQPTFPGSFRRMDVTREPVALGIEFDAVYALDFLEHIDPANEWLTLYGMLVNLRPDGICIIGMPSLESQPYASEQSRRCHVNCKTEDGLRATMAKHFRNVFMFGMNDATLHVGFGPMCHYRLALCAGKL